MAQQHPALEDLCPTCDLNYRLTPFRKLASWVEKVLIPFDSAHSEFPDRAGIHRCLFLVDHSHPPGSPVLLLELDAVRMASLRLLASDLLAQLSHYLFVANPAHPTCHDLNGYPRHTEPATSSGRWTALTAPSPTVSARPESASRRHTGGIPCLPPRSERGHSRNGTSTGCGRRLRRRN